MTRRRALRTAVALAVWASAAGAGCLAQTLRKRKPERPVPAQIIVGMGVEGLPPAVVDMRGEILAAVEGGEIDELKRAMDLNELKPELGEPAGSDAIAHLKGLSADGKGLSVLLDLGRLLEGSWAAIPGGRDIENNRLYVWPHFAEVPLKELSEAERAGLLGLVGEVRAAEMMETGRWRGWRLVIGADGVWHSFVRVGE